MLNKGICIKCCNISAHEFSSGEIGNVLMRWDKNDDSDWEKGFVICPFLGKNGRVNEDPPEKCFYVLEQLMSQKQC